LTILRPQDHEELFNLHHAQARNVVECIFGILKHHFGLFQGAPEYSAQMQAKFVPALAALHNFILIHEPIAETTDQVEEGDNSRPVQDIQIQLEELGSNITRAERQRANSRRDGIAKAMWEDYCRILEERQSH
jgi:hypothetical protein